MARWDLLGVSENQFPKIRGSGPLIVGGGRCVWEDFNKLGRKWDGDVLTVNDITMHFPLRVKHAYSNDKFMLPRWVSARRPRYRINFEESINLHSCNEAKYQWPFPGHGSSGLNACYVGVGMGYSSIILIGIPLDNSGHYFDPPWVQTNFEREVPQGRVTGVRYWENAVKIFDGKVKSMSGRTRELFGEP